MDCSLRCFLFGLFISSNHKWLTAAKMEDSPFIDDNIPEDWRQYFSEDSDTRRLLNIVANQRDYSSQNSETTKMFQNIVDPRKNIFQGDITGIHPDSALENPTEFSKKIYHLWPDATVFYEVSSIDFSMEVFVRVAMNDLENKTCVRFIPRHNKEKNYLIISSGKSGCESSIGMKGGPQNLLMHIGCQDTLGATQHELMHALGIPHEQARADRGDFVWINHKNIRKDAAAQFVKQSLSMLNQVDADYDYQSIMHYPWNAYAINSLYPTIIPKAKGANFGKRNFLSQLDVEKINKLYKCDPVKPQKFYTRDYYSTWTKWWQLCDGVQDTPEGWDEDPYVCVKMCVKLSKSLPPWLGWEILFNLPKTKQCIKKTYLCDGIRHTENGDTEDTSICQNYCQGGGFLTVPPSHQCIHFQDLCNGHLDTRDGSDEERDNCDTQCSNFTDVDKRVKGEYFQLEPLGQCMQKRSLCDGVKNNDFDTTEDVTVCKAYCKNGGYFNTDTTSQCIHWSSLCDGLNDTTDGWDEIPKNCNAACPVVSELIGDLVNLPERQQCLQKTSLCDGIQTDRDDLSEDADLCDEKCRGNGYFPTPDIHQCIRLTSLCDGEQDTRNNWDEIPKNCEQYCRTGPHNTDLEVEIVDGGCIEKKI